MSQQEMKTNKTTHSPSKPFSEQIMDIIKYLVKGILAFYLIAGVIVLLFFSMILSHG